MRRTISGLIAAVAVMSAAPAMACGGGLFGTGCSPCGQSYVGGCAPQVYTPPVYVAPVAAYSGCNTGCGGWGGGWATERLADPEQQYYYVNQGPAYTGPGNWAPRRTYQEGYVSGSYGYGNSSYYGYGNSSYYGYGGGYRARSYARPWRSYTGYRYSVRPSVRYGYAARHGYASRYSLPARAYGGRVGMRYGARVGTPHRYGYHNERALRRHY
jgi:hypothetical protein